MARASNPILSGVKLVNQTPQRRNYKSSSPIHQRLIDCQIDREDTHLQPSGAKHRNPPQQPSHRAPISVNRIRWQLPRAAPHELLHQSLPMIPQNLLHTPTPRAYAKIHIISQNAGPTSITRTKNARRSSKSTKPILENRRRTRTKALMKITTLSYPPIRSPSSVPHNTAPPNKKPVIDFSIRCP